jgi:hypothetical protein
VPDLPTRKSGSHVEILHLSRQDRHKLGIAEGALRAPADAAALRFAFADPPYPGQARRYYGDHPDFAGEVDHAALVEQLMGYDGWALCTAARTLPGVLHYCPPTVRVMAWVKPGLVKINGCSVAHMWEPVLIHGGRRVPDSNVRDWFEGPPGRKWEWAGGKTEPFCRWVFDALGARHGDELTDLFPGSGIVAETWASHVDQERLIA